MRKEFRAWKALVLEQIKANQDAIHASQVESAARRQLVAALRGAIKGAEAAEVKLKKKELYDHHNG